VFEVVDKESQKVRVIKDCWVEERRERYMEHEIVEEIKKTIDAEFFSKHFVGICGHRKTDTSGGFQAICNILTKGEFKPQPLILTRTSSKPIYSKLAKGSAPSQSHHSQRSPPSTQPAPTSPPHPRFRYQVVYSEKGKSLLEVTSLNEVFVHLEQIVNGTQRDSANQSPHLRLDPALLFLHKAGWVHRDLSPGNIIVVDGKAKISDLEFAKRRVAQDLERLTRQTDQPLSVAQDTRTVGLRLNTFCEPPVLTF